MKSAASAENDLLGGAFNGLEIHATCVAASGGRGLAADAGHSGAVATPREMGVRDDHIETCLSTNSPNCHSSLTGFLVLFSPAAGGEDSGAHVAAGLGSVDPAADLLVQPFPRVAGPDLPPDGSWWQSEVTIARPDRPRATSPRRNAGHPARPSEEATSMPRTSRLPSPRRALGTGTGRRPASGPGTRRPSHRARPPSG